MNAYTRKTDILKYHIETQIKIKINKVFTINSICWIKKLDITWTSKYNEFMRYDNTINLISRIREVSNIFIVSELEKMGMKGIAPSHGGIIAILIEHRELTMTEIAEKINKDRSTVTTLVKKLNKIGGASYEEERSY